MTPLRYNRIQVSAAEIIEQRFRTGHLADERVSLPIS